MKIFHLLVYFPNGCKGQHLGQSEDNGLEVQGLTWAQGSKHWGHDLPPSQTHEQEADSEAEQPGLQQVPK